MKRFFIIAGILMAVECSSPPPLMTPQLQKVSVEWTSEKRSEMLHRNCIPKGTATAVGKNVQWLDYNARLEAEKAGADVASIIYQDNNFYGVEVLNWQLMLFCCECKKGVPATKDSSAKK